MLAIPGCEVPAERVGRPAADSSEPAPISKSTASERSASASFPLARAGFARGSADAPLTVYELSDFGCQYCGVFAREEFPVLNREFVETGRVRWVFIPTEGASVNSAEAGRAALCAGEQDRFWEMHDRLFHDQRAWMRPRDPEPVLSTMAESLQLDAQRFAACYRGGAARDRLQQASRLSLLLGMRATPSFFVDGRLVEGALPAPQFAELLLRIERAAQATDEVGR